MVATEDVAWDELPGWPDFDGSRRGSAEAGKDHELNRFHSRWLLARRCRGLEVDGYVGAETALGYQTLFRVFLAYSVIDDLRTVYYGAKGKKKAETFWSVPDALLADRLRDVLKMDLVCADESLGDGMIRALKARDDDVLVIAAALRHMFVHGSGTAHGTGLAKPGAQAVVDDLCEAIMGEAARRFAEYVREHYVDGVWRERR